eukprot:CAMPEP_0170578038 /NCGR_PEP_ID=MMETSP0224-20130122/5247_1 /TAXON_ID=285029 /ORGANISM="Togula jolla, Strain CCCM 725" /LENGTH=45 /DNA_ID= /DNA_START= /DNA_END= /DNA_ORIENTATION=
MEDVRLVWDPMAEAGHGAYFQSAEGPRLLQSIWPDSHELTGGLRT